MKNTHGDAAALYSSKRKLDNVGYIQFVCGIQNDLERIKKLEVKRFLASSIETINAFKRREKQAKSSKTNAEIANKAPAALKKLRPKGMDFSMLTISELCDVATYFHTALKKGKKDSIVAEIRALMAFLREFISKNLRRQQAFHFQNVIPIVAIKMMIYVVI
jgi:hypothetical protein